MAGEGAGNSAEEIRGPGGSAGKGALYRCNKKDHIHAKTLNKLFYIITPYSLHTRNCVGIILRLRTFHTVIIVLELHLHYMT